MEITENYIGGILDSKGGFYIQTNKNDKKYLYFKLSIEDDKILPIYNFLRDRLKISIKQWGKMYYITRAQDIITLIGFMDKYCTRRDYKKLIEKHSPVLMDEV